MILKLEIVSLLKMSIRLTITTVKNRANILREPCVAGLKTRIKIINKK